MRYQCGDDLSLSPEAYREFEHAASLKGLLKPFKGKGELAQFAAVTRGLQQRLAELMLAQTAVMAQPPLALLGIRLTLQNTAAGTTFLRWRSHDFMRMGTPVWERVMQNPHASADLRQALHQLETNRIVLNLQMSLIHSMQRQALDCAAKMANAERALGHPSPGTEHAP